MSLRVVTMRVSVAMRAFLPNAGACVRAYCE